MDRWAVGQDKISEEVTEIEKRSPEDRAWGTPEFRHQVDKGPAEQTRKGAASKTGKQSRLSVLRKRVYKVPLQILQVGRLSWILRLDWVSERWGGVRVKKPDWCLKEIRRAGIETLNIENSQNVFLITRNRDKKY